MLFQWEFFQSLKFNIKLSEGHRSGVRKVDDDRGGYFQNFWPKKSGGGYRRGYFLKHAIYRFKTLINDNLTLNSHYHVSPFDFVQVFKKKFYLGPPFEFFSSFLENLP